MTKAEKFETFLKEISATYEIEHDGAHVSFTVESQYKFDSNCLIATFTGAKSRFAFLRAGTGGKKILTKWEAIFYCKELTKPRASKCSHIPEDETGYCQIADDGTQFCPECGKTKPEPEDSTIEPWARWGFIMDK